MSRTDSVFLVCCVALVACAAAYHWHPSGPRYYPLDHTWRTQKVKGKPSMGWYWRSGWAFGVSAVAALGAGVGIHAASGSDVEPEEQKTRLPTWAYALLTVVALCALAAVSVEIIEHAFTKWHTWEPWTMPR